MVLKGGRGVRGRRSKLGMGVKNILNRLLYSYIEIMNRAKQNKITDYCNGVIFKSTSCISNPYLLYFNH